jgi:hypothetical protein
VFWYQRLSDLSNLTNNRKEERETGRERGAALRPRSRSVIGLSQGLAIIIIDLEYFVEVSPVRPDSFSHLFVAQIGQFNGQGATADCLLYVFLIG